MKRSIFILPLIAGLSACGGSDSGSDNGGNPTPPPTPTPLAKVISGELTAKNGNLLTINQQTVDVSSASVNPVPSRTQPQLNLADLRVGMQLTVTTDGNIADAIIFDSLMTAPVTSIDSDNNLMVAGMKVLTNNAKLEGVTSISQLADKFVEISGYAVDGKTIQATFIELEDDTTQTELEGVVTQLDTVNNTFMLNQVKVSGVLPQGIKLGDWVEVEGELTDTNGVFSLSATDIEIDNPSFDDLLDNDDDLEVEGIISWISPKMDHLVINQNQSVAILTNTQFDDGTKADLKVGANIEVEGTWDLGAANIKASKIEFDDNDSIPESEIENIEFEVPGKPVLSAAKNTITMNGITFLATPYTEFDDVQSNQLNGQTWVEMSGYEQNGQHIVLEVELSEQDSQIEIEGVVLNANGTPSIFGYSASDDSLNGYVGQRVEVECTLGANNEISSCTKDND
ncbi:DUF5666 domain-containing protein [Shewanella sp. NIFS-20-20]|uniref:DUF5666 domain-containing protein n=1 Tax=Shewanella sp. NIFS-20-20 TaxID=2853806 RepID=UPI001C446CA0|nr:DUF5666 domain-containing protein [Shewanella sp. NIFS-20-20]MBV7314705.1 hypothetical protein [Shewanella sp. NIFS-20-20]